MSQPQITSDTSMSIPATWTLSGGTCPPMSGSLGTSVHTQIRRWKKATESTGKTPYHKRPPTNWWCRYGKVSFPIYNVVGTKLSAPCKGQLYQAIPDAWSSGPSLVWVHTPYEDSVLASCTTKLLNEIKGDNGQLGLAFAERKKTEKLFIDTAQAVTDDIRAFRKKQPSEWLTYVNQQGRVEYLRKRDTWRRVGPGPTVPFGKTFSKRYLAMVYGWKPLLSDLNRAMSGISNLQKSDSFTFVKKARVSKTGAAFNVHGTSINGFTATMGVSRIDRCRMEVEYEVVSSVLSSLSSLGLTNPVSLAWELVPYSFVVDWFLPLGNWFNTFDATLGKRFSSGFVSQSFRLQNAGFSAGTPTVAGWQLSKVHAGGSAAYDYISFNRDVLSSFPSPLPPAFKNPCSPSHVANALALLIGAVTR